MGIFAGICAVRLAKASTRWKHQYPSLIIEKENKVSAIVAKKNKAPRKIKMVFVIILLILSVLYLQSYLYPAHTIIPSNIILNILLRSILILLLWYLVLGPLVMFMIKRSLISQQQKYKNEINEVMLLLPQTKFIFRQAFKLSETEKGLGRIKLFLKILLVSILADQ